MNEPTLGPVEASPLLEADPQSLEELFSKDPLQLTEVDIETIVTTLAAGRQQWMQEENKTKSKARTAKPKSDAPKLALADLFPELK